MPDLERWDALPQRLPDWFRDAPLGIFIHWGAYAVPSWAEPSAEFGAAADVGGGEAGGEGLGPARVRTAQLRGELSETGCLAGGELTCVLGAKAGAGAGAEERRCLGSS